MLPPPQSMRTLPVPTTELPSYIEAKRIFTPITKLKLKPTKMRGQYGGNGASDSTSKQLLKPAHDNKEGLEFEEVEPSLVKKKMAFLDLPGGKSRNRCPSGSPIQIADVLSRNSE